MSEAPLPANGAFAQGSVLNAIACPAKGRCVAVGGYNTRANVGEGLIEVQ